MSVFTTVPHQGPPKPGQLSPDQLATFFHQGFIVVNNVFTDAELKPMKDEIDDIVSIVADRLFAAGKIKDTYSGAGHRERLTLLEAEFPGATELVHKAGETKAGACPPALRHLWTQPRLLNIMEQILGPDIVDAAYFMEAEGELMVTGWIPLLDTNARNGCLQLVPGAHKSGKVGQHEGLWKDTWYIFMDDDNTSKLGTPVKEAVTCEVPYGSMVLFNNLTPHRSLPNESGEIRWSVDVRWAAGGRPTGFSVKPPVWFRKAGLDLEPDWEGFNRPSDDWIAPKSSSSDPELETAINPKLWLPHWPLTHQNRHSEFMRREEEAA